MTDLFDRMMRERFARQRDDLPLPDFADVLRRAARSPDELESREQHPMSEIRFEPHRRGFSRPGVRIPRLRYAIPAVAAICGAVVAAAVVMLNPGRSNASPVRPAIPLSQATITTGLERSIVHAAARDGVSPRSVVVLGGSGSGRQFHAVLAGTNASGATLLSFLDGFGMSAFLPGSRFANTATPMFVSDTVSGPSTQARTVGITGISTEDIARIAVQLANGTTLTLSLDQAPGIAYEGFSYVSSEASSFPAKVTAYDGSGHMVAQHKVDAAPLCPSSQPHCTG